MSSNHETTLLVRQSRPAPPADRYNLVYISFYLIGIGSLLPWNFFITAKKYFQCKLRNTTDPWSADCESSTATDLQVMFEGSIAVASTLPNLLFNFFTAALAARIPLKGRIISANVTVIVVFIVTVFLVKTDTDEWQFQFYAVTLVSVVILNAASAVYSASMCGLAGMFPIKYMQAAMSGQAVGGVFAAVANIISLSAGGSVIQSAFIFFIAATVTSLLSLLSYCALYINRCSLYYIEGSGPITIEVSESEDEAGPAQPTYTVKPQPHSSYYLLVLKQIWVQALGAFVVFFVSLTCFPALASSISSMSEVSSIWKDQYFTPVICFLLFNIGDCTSRVLAGFIKWPRIEQGKSLLTMCFFRIVLIPLLLLCNAQPRGIPVVFNNDFYPIFFILTLGLSNGYLGTLCMMYGPKKVAVEHSEFAGVALSVFLTAGLACGSVLGLFIVKWI